MSYKPNIQKRCLHHGKLQTGSFLCNFPKRELHLFIYTGKNILIAFEDTIRLSADILIASAHALIVFTSSTNRATTTRKHTSPQNFIFCVFVVTLSHYEHKQLKIVQIERVTTRWQQIFCCHTLKHLFINVFTPP